MQNRFDLKQNFLAVFVAAMAGLLPTAQADESRTRAPTIVLVHGAFADSSSWNRVIPKLESRGYPVIAAANPLRTLAGDAAYVSSIVKHIPGPVVLVGHSYGGAVISNAARGNANVKALVYVAAFAPDSGESAFGIIARFPGSILGDAVVPTPLSTGGNDLYVNPRKFREPFAADVPAKITALMAATQRPITDIAGNEPSGEPAWRKLPSWFIYGSGDLSITSDAHEFMAARAKARDTRVIKGASHVVMISHPSEVAHIILEATSATFE
jgi:pimeloyl-ACP methyl ester carboxylesterase